ncbi:hypothetical protein IWW34DRAFT_811379 [Fusarium oxysporum f. sp. albedinis]|nr:hypothetical protein IWW34DRAFT_811379 [Fusarium oxysporum f. sp. albedinis]
MCTYVCQPILCVNSRNGQVCANNFRLDQPAQYVPDRYGASSYCYDTQRLPPTPQRSSAPSSPPYGLYRDGDEPDCSYTNNPSKKQSSALFIKGQGVLDQNCRNRQPNSRSQERILLADSPSTPSQKWSSPRTTSAPPTTYKYLPKQRRVRFVVVDSDCNSNHHRDYSSSSLDGRQSNDEVHRERRRENKGREEAELHLRDRIAEHNAKINSRHVVPAELPLPAAHLTTNGRFVGAMITDSRAGLAEERRRLSFEEERREDKARRPARREENKEEEAQRERHGQCMQPKRHPTSNRSRKRPVVTRMYRYE